MSAPLGQVPRPWKPPCLVIKHTLNTTTQRLLFVRSKAEHPRLPRRPDVHTRKPPVTAARSHGGWSHCRSCPLPATLPGATPGAAGKQPRDRTRVPALPPIGCNPLHNAHKLTQLPGPRVFSFVKRGRLTGPQRSARTVQREAGDTYLEPRIPQNMGATPRTTRPRAAVTLLRPNHSKPQSLYQRRMLRSAAGGGEGWVRLGTRCSALEGVVLPRPPR